MKRLMVLLLAAFTLVSATGCQRKPAAVVNGAEISRKVLKWNLDRRMGEHKARGAVITEPALKTAVLDQLVAEKLMAQAAKEQGMTVDDKALEVEVHRITQRMGEEEFKKSLRDASMSEVEFREMVREKLLAAKFAGSLVGEDDVTEEEVRKFYKESPTPFLVPESVLIRFIQVPTKDQADEIMKELTENKTPFDELADRLDENKAAIVSGYSWATPAFFRDEIADAFRSIGEGEYAGPFKTKEGYFVFMIKERQHERAKSFEEARDDIRRMLLEKRREAALAHWLAQTKRTADIVIN